MVICLTVMKFVKNVILVNKSNGTKWSVTSVTQTIIPETTNGLGDFLYLGCRSAYSRAAFSRAGRGVEMMLP